MVRVVAALGAVLALARPAHADGDYFARLATAVRAGLDEAAASHAPKLAAPVPVKVTWKAVRLGSLDLGAELVALTAADLDHDGKAELYAVTTREVVAFTLVNQRVKELARLPFSGEIATPAPRDVVGTASVDGNEVVASVSSWVKELRIAWSGKALTAQPGQAGFALCPGVRMSLVPGRNHFGDATTPLFGVRCRNDLVDPTGKPLRVRAELTASKLEVTVDVCNATGAACQPVGKYAYKDYGVAFEVADVDHDGRPEVIVTGANPPGDPDRLKVMTIGGDEKGMFRRQFTGGVVGIVVLDADGDGFAEVVAAVRLAGSTRVDLWRLD